MKQIQLFKPIFDTKAVLAEIEECLDLGWPGLGYKTIQFEEKFKEYINVENAHFLNSATSGLHLALEIIKITKGIDSGNVFTTPLTFISDSHAIKHARLNPIFVDIDQYLCMDPYILSTIFKLHKAVAVIYVGMGGNIGKLNYVAEICKEHKVPLIFDASHCMGTYYDNRHVGNEADFTIFSFQAVKNLPTADSGMIVCKNKTDDTLARRLAWLGINRDTYTRQKSGGNWYYEVDFTGYKYHGNSIMAAIALVGLRNLKSQNAIRTEQAGRYSARLNGFYQKVPIYPGCLSSRHLYQVRVAESRRNYVIESARREGIQLGVHYRSHNNYPMYADKKYYCPKADAASRELISLPIGPHLSEEDVTYIIEVLNGIRF